MQYSMLIYLSPEQFAARTDPLRREQFWGAFVPYMQQLYAAGIVVAGSGLEPPDTGTTIDLRGTGTVQDGPYADTKEQLGGLFVVEVPDLDNALDWARRCPPNVASHIEVRPNL